MIFDKGPGMYKCSGLPNGHSFAFYDDEERDYYLLAQRQCRSDNASLVVVDSKEKQDWLNKVAPGRMTVKLTHRILDRSLNCSFAISLAHSFAPELREGSFCSWMRQFHTVSTYWAETPLLLSLCNPDADEEWHWEMADESMVELGNGYNAWKSMEPNNPSSERCAINLKGWESQTCNNKWPFVCEMSGIGKDRRWMISMYASFFKCFKHNSKFPLIDLTTTVKPR